MVIRHNLGYRVDSLSFAELLKYSYRRKIERLVVGIRYGGSLIQSIVDVNGKPQHSFSELLFYQARAL